MHGHVENKKTYFAYVDGAEENKLAFMVKDSFKNRSTVCLSLTIQLPINIFFEYKC